MCGRFVRFRSWADLRRTLTLLSPSPVDLPPSYNVAPTQQILVARENQEPAVMRWGLIPSWAKDKKAPQINARADTVASKPMFRSAFKKRRCLVLADGYYEWKTIGKQKQPYYFRLKHDEAFTFAGIWEEWHGDGETLETCAIITTDANDMAKDVHNRMPVILTGDEALAWIDPTNEDAGKLLRPYDSEKMTCFEVNPIVGNVRNNSPDCIKPVEAA